MHLQFSFRVSWAFHLWPLVPPELLSSSLASCPRCLPVALLVTCSDCAAIKLTACTTSSLTNPLTTWARTAGAALSSQCRLTVAAAIIGRGDLSTPGHNLFNSGSL